jgi:5'-nucleotidase
VPSTWPPPWPQLRRKNPNHIFVAAGDLIGATPLLSALFRDEPTVEVAQPDGPGSQRRGQPRVRQGRGRTAALAAWRLRPGRQLQGPAPFKGAQLPVPGRQHGDIQTGQTLLPAYHVKTFQGMPVAFIGLTLKDTPDHRGACRRGRAAFRRRGRDRQRLVPELQRQGVQAIVVLIHEGGVPTGDYNECPGISGPIVDIVKKLDKAVDAVISGHTHRAYNCRIDGRLVTSGDKYGTIVTEIDLVLDPATATSPAPAPTT